MSASDENSTRRKKKLSVGLDQMFNFLKAIVK